MRAEQPGLALAGGVGLALVPSSWLEHDLPRAVVAIEAPKALAAITIGVLCLMRFRQHRDAWCIALGSTAGIAGSLGLVVAILPDLADVGDGAALTRARGTGLLLVTLGMCASTALIASTRPLVLDTLGRVRRFAAGWTVAMVVAVLAHREITAAGAGATKALRLGEAICLGAAAIWLASRGRRLSAPIAPWLAVGAALAGGARLHLALVPPNGPGWLTSSHLLTTSARSVVVAGLVVMLLHERRVTAATILRAERRRVARELHDGLASLALIKGQARWLAGRQPDLAAPLADLAKAAEDALDHTHRTINGLATPARLVPGDADDDPIEVGAG